MPSGKRDPKYWLYLEPYVHISTAGHAVLFYNSLTGSRFELPKSSRTARVIERLVLPANGYVTGLTGADMKDPAVNSLVAQLQETFMGDLLNLAWSKGKPANILPEPFFKSYLNKERISKPEAREAIDFDNYIHEVVLYLNSDSSSDGDSFPLATRQFVFPGNTLEKAAVLPWQDLRRFIQHLARYKITGVQVAGSDINGYPDLLPLSDLMAKAGFPVHYHVNARHFNQGVAQTLTTHAHSKLGIHFTFPIDLDLLNRIITELPAIGDAKKIDFQFAVTSAEELDAAQEIISRANLPNPWLNPYYNGKNFSFFRETVFITREDIGNSRPVQHQVFSRMTVNETDFGKFTLLPDGSIHANLNDPPVGILGSVRPEEMILKELLDGVSWTRTRKNISPCRDCLYHFLCPPVSSYELLMNRFNFCDVFENPAV